MRFQDALFNWVQIKIVSDARPEDHAAKETVDFFELMLREDHGLTFFTFETAVDEAWIEVKYSQNGESKLQRFDSELAGQLLRDIQSNPKYNDI